MTRCNAYDIEGFRCKYDKHEGVHKSYDGESYWLFGKAFAPLTEEERKRYPHPVRDAEYDPEPHISTTGDERG